MKYLYFLGYLLIFSACTADFSPENNAAWMNGSWKRTFNNVVQLENWQVNSSSATGKNAAILNSDTLEMYQMEIAKVEGDWELHRMVMDENIHFNFKLIHHSPDSLVFENREDFFPQQIMYKRLSDSTLLRREKGQNNGMVQEVDFEYRRIK